MPSKNKTFSIYPPPAVTAILGDTPAEIMPHLAAWADVLARAIRANEAEFARAEWNAIADACNGLWWDADSLSPAVHLAAEVADAGRLNGLGEKWGVDAESLAARLAALSPAHAWAVALVVRRFWDQAGEVDHARDEWWTLKFYRRQAD